MPQFTETKDKFAIHIELCQTCNKIFSENNITSIAEIEQVYILYILFIK